jgi:hypothetical protein
VVLLGLLAGLFVRIVLLPVVVITIFKFLNAREVLRFFTAFILMMLVMLLFILLVMVMMHFMRLFIRFTRSLLLLFERFLRLARTFPNLFLRA